MTQTQTGLMYGTQAIAKLVLAIEANQRDAILDASLPLAIGAGINGCQTVWALFEHAMNEAVGGYSNIAFEILETIALSIASANYDACYGMGHFDDFDRVMEVVGSNM